MSRHLTAQQLADELGVTRQLIYYHAKKLPAEEKIYDDDKTLVFSPSQQSEISSYMTDTIKENKNEHLSNATDGVKANALTQDKGEKARIIQTNPVSNGLTNDKSNHVSKDIAEVVSKEKVEESNNDVSNVTSDEQTSDNSKLDSSMSNETETKRSESVKMYIQHVLREQVNAIYPIQQQEQIQESLFAELEEKNQQISTLHKLLDQQQQLALIAEQKHQKLLDTLGVEDIKQLEQIVKQAAEKAADTTSETPIAPEKQEKKSWFQRIFG